MNDMSQKRVMQAVVEEDEGVGASKERLQQAAEMEVEVCGERALHMEGEMEKKSPAHNLWQGRWFKLMTKQRESTSGEFLVTNGMNVGVVVRCYFSLSNQ